MNKFNLTDFIQTFFYFLNILTSNSLWYRCYCGYNDLTGGGHIDTLSFIEIINTINEIHIRSLTVYSFKDVFLVHLALIQSFFLLV